MCWSIAKIGAFHLVGLNGLMCVEEEYGLGSGGRRADGGVKEEGV